MRPQTAAVESAAEAAVRCNPFPGLRSFEPEEEHLFFGRQRQVDELLGRLRRTRFLTVVGASGSGKSSLVRSGLIPSLHGGFMVQAGSSWRIALLRPGDDPTGNLAAALAVPGVLGGAPGDEEDPDLAAMNRSLLEATLGRSALGLVDCLRQARIPAAENLLVVVDQFEELFRFKRNPRIHDSREAAAAFVRLLLATAGQEEAPIYVVLTMRSDFIGNLTEFPGLAEAANEGQYLVPRLTREERRQAIVGPVAVGGGEISPRLVLRLLNDVGDDPDQLPILQHALLRTWDYWEGHRTPGEPLDLRHYEAIGTLKEALSQHAEEAYRELADGREQEIAETLFKALTERGLDSRGVRRPSRLGEIAELAGAEIAEVAAVVEHFRAPGRSFLMPPSVVALDRVHGDTVLDISHESLMRVWTRLLDWVDEEARSAQLFLRLSKAAAQYQEGVGGLWRDPELQLALNWREETRPTAAWGERYDPAFERAMLFLEYSRKERDLWIEGRERARRRALRRARWLAAVLGTAALLTLVLGLYALLAKAEAQASAREAVAQQQVAQQKAREARRQRLKAEKQQRVAESRKAEAERSRRLADVQRGIAESERQRAEDEEKKALDQRQQAEASRALAETAKAQAVAAKQATEEQRRFAESERRSAVAAKDTALAAAAETHRLGMLQLARALSGQALRLQREGELAALLAIESARLNARFGGDPDSPLVYSALRLGLGALAPDREPVLRQHGDAVRALALAGGGRMLATGADDGGVRLFDLARPLAPPTLLAAPGGAEIRALAAGGTRLAAGALDGSIRLWDLAKPAAAPLRLAAPGLPGGEQGGAGGPPAPVAGLAFAPDGSTLAAATADGAVRLWDPASGRLQATLAAGPARRLTALACDPAGGRLAAASAGGVLIWDLGHPAAPARVLAAGTDVRALAFGPGGRLAAGTAAGTVLLFDLKSAAPATLSGHSTAVTALAFAAARPLLASASTDGTVRLWDAAAPAAEPLELRDHKGWVWAVALSPDGERVLSGGADRTVQVRWTATAPYVEALCGVLRRNLTAAEWRTYLPAAVPYERSCPGLPPGEGAERPSP